MEELLRFIVVYLLKNPGGTLVEMRAAAIVAGEWSGPEVNTAAQALLTGMISHGIFPVGAVYADVDTWAVMVGQRIATNQLRLVVEWVVRVNPASRRADLVAKRDEFQAEIDALRTAGPFVSTEIARLEGLDRTEAENAILVALRFGWTNGQNQVSVARRHLDKILAELSALPEL